MTSDAQELRDGFEGPTVFAALADDRRRTVLAVLFERDHAVTVPDLTRFLAARETGHEPSAISDEMYGSVGRTLQHVHLPKLATAGLIDLDDAVVRLAYEPLAIRVAELTREFVEVSDERRNFTPLDDGFEALADERRLAVVAVLQSAERALTLSELADRVASMAMVALSADRIAVSLDHIHLPLLDDLGIVTYDREAREITFEGLPRACERLISELRIDGEFDGEGTAFPGSTLAVFSL